jgi:DNA helicase HerA-like ATPase
VPGTNYPVTVDLKDAVTHHLAILGVTGSGKSVFARDLIRKVVGEGIKVICVDFTQEYAGKFTDLKIASIANTDEQKKLFNAIDAVSAEQCKFKSQQNACVIEHGEKDIGNTFYLAIKRFLESEENSIALFELPDVTNTTGILDYTKWFFKALFFIARKHANFGKRLCIVLEEAHTVVPEWNFIGVAERDAQSLVNSIGQIALQGRKYGVGFIIIAQRTANVSKTILTQCNSIVAFQQFDKTSSDFLSNYMGPEMVNVMPNLRQRQAIGVGKAFTSKIPIIFHVPEINEST